jgi:hypothetical protein
MLNFVNLGIQWRRTLVASALAFGVVLAGTYFLIENVRAGGAVLVAAIVALAAYLALNAPNPTGQRGQSLGVLLFSSALAIAVGVGGFAAAILLVASSRT